MPRSVAQPRRPIPQPGQIFCPVGRALDVIGDRWTLVLVRHLLDGPVGFQELRARSGIAPRVLASRLRALVKRGFVERTDAARPLYQVSERGRSLEPVIAATARWYLRHGLDHLRVDTTGFSAASARSILDSLPFLLREERAQGVDLTFEIRLSGLGGGVWTVRIADGACTIRAGFAERADVRYTAEARVWCAVALGISEAKDVYRKGQMSKDGGREAMDYYFHQIARNGGADPTDAKKPTDQTRLEGGASSPPKRTGSPRRRRSGALHVQR